MIERTTEINGPKTDVNVVEEFGRLKDYSKWKTKNAVRIVREIGKFLSQTYSGHS